MVFVFGVFLLGWRFRFVMLGFVLEVFVVWCLDGGVVSECGLGCEVVCGVCVGGCGVVLWDGCCGRLVDFFFGLLIYMFIF